MNLNAFAEVLHASTIATNAILEHDGVVRQIGEIRSDGAFQRRHQVCESL